MRITVLGSSAVLVLAGVACGHNPIEPTQSPLAITRIAISGGDSVAPGATIQLSATAFLSDGTTRIVTTAVIWTSSNPELMTISETGLVTATSVRGEGQITATYQGSLAVQSPGARSNTQPLLVLPSGTYVLSGSVTDGGIPIKGGVEVEVTSGIGAGMAMTANPSFKFYGVAGETEIRMTKPGYETQVLRILVTRSQTSQIDLVPLEGRLITAGTYTLRLEAAAACQQQLPGSVRSRTYTAVISQSGSQLTAVLSGANMGGAWGPADRLTGFVQPGEVRFGPDRYSGEGAAGTFRPPSILEVIATSQGGDLTYFTFFGAVVTTPDGNGYSGILNGTLEVITMPGPSDDDWWDSPFQKLASCRSATHQFTLTR